MTEAKGRNWWEEDQEEFERHRARDIVERIEDRGITVRNARNFSLTIDNKVVADLADAAQEIREMRQWKDVAILAGAEIQKDLSFRFPLKEEHASLIKALEEAKARETSLRELLHKHHRHHLETGVIGLPDGDGGWIEIENGSEYGDSELYEITEKALADHLPPSEPTPRGGVTWNWWAEWIKATRNIKAMGAALESVDQMHRAGLSLAGETIESVRRALVPYRAAKERKAAALRALSHTGAKNDHE